MGKFKPSDVPIKVSDQPAGVVVPKGVDPKIAQAAERKVEAKVDEDIVNPVCFGPHSGKYLIPLPREKNSPKDEDIRLMVKFNYELDYFYTTTNRRLIAELKKQGFKVHKR